MVAGVVVGQQWAMFNSARRQWLLARIVRLENGRATLKYDPRYDIEPPDNVCDVDALSLPSTPMQFRLVE